MSLPTPISVQKLQRALHDKAKGSPNFRFYAPYDKVYRQDVLVFAYDRCKANGGAPSVHGQTFEDIEEYGVTGHTVFPRRCPLFPMPHFRSSFLCDRAAVLREHASGIGYSPM